MEYITPKLQDVIHGITDLKSIETDLWGVGKIPTEDFDLVVDIGSGDGCFEKLVSKYNTKAAVIKADSRDRCNAEDVMPIHICDKMDGEDVIVAKPSVMYSDQLGRPVINIIATQAMTSMTLHGFLDVYTKDIENNRIILKISNVSLEHLVSELPYIHNVKALIIIIPCNRCEAATEFINTLKQVFDIVEDFSSGEVMYARCFNIKAAPKYFDKKQLGSGDDTGRGNDNNNPNT